MTSNNSYALANLAVDLIVTQIINVNKEIHCDDSKAILKTTYLNPNNLTLQLEIRG